MEHMLPSLIAGSAVLACILFFVMLFVAEDGEHTILAWILGIASGLFLTTCIGLDAWQAKLVAEKAEVPKGWHVITGPQDCLPLATVPLNRQLCLDGIPIEIVPIENGPLDCVASECTTIILRKE